MHAVAAKVMVRERPGRAALGHLLLGVAVVLALAAWGCGSGGGVGSVVGLDAGEAAPSPVAASVAGTWSGGGDKLNLTWRLIQEGESVRGSSQANGDSGWNAREGRVVGKVSGSSFAFSDTHPPGAPSTASCAAELQGTLEVREIVQVVPPRPPYPSGYPIAPPSKATRILMSGHVEGSACGKPFSGMVTLFRD